jgi:outer membrane immunogenic protein
MKTLFGALIGAALIVSATPALADGFYVGVHGGWAHSESEWTDLDGDWHTSFPAPVGTFEDDAGAFGWQIGYDAYFGSFVLGAVGDLSFADLDSTFTGWGYDGGASCDCVTIRDEGSILASLRGRVGVTFDWIMPYATVGVAFTDLEHTWNLEHTWTEDGDVSDSWPAFGNEFGVVYGGGIEITPLADKRWSFAAEGLYYDFGEETSTNQDNYRMRVDTNVMVYRLALNYHL